MRKILLILFTLVSISFLPTDKAFADECPIDTTNGEFTCSEGVCYSEQYACVNNHPCYNDFYKNESTGCELQPRDPRFHCDDTRTCDCEAGFVTGEAKPVIVRNNCGPGSKPYAPGNVTGFPPRTDYTCTCVPESASVTPSKLLCSMEFKPCKTDDECKAGGSGCAQHTCVDLDPQVLSLPLFGGTGGDTKRCLAPDSPYGKQYSKLFPTPIKNKLINCGTDADCLACVKGDDPANPGTEASPAGVPSAFGCIPVEPGGLIGRIFGILLGLAGGIALLIIIYSGYRMVTSTGNPEALQGARETLTAAIVGLLFIIFSFVILEIIGVDILRIPGFGTRSSTVAPTCLDYKERIVNDAECGRDRAKALCDDYRRRSGSETFTGVDREIWDLCISKGYIR